MIIPDKMKEATIIKLKSLLKYYLVEGFLSNGYNPDVKNTNKVFAQEAKLILKTIDLIQQNLDVQKDKLQRLFDMYNEYHKEKGELWHVQK